MARKLEFDRDAVLLKAMRLFWEKGYEASSMEDLVTTMGINRFSIYNSFGDKKALFLAALRCYQQSVFKELLKPLNADLPARECIENYLDNFGTQLQKPSARLGCLVQKTGQSFVVSDQQVASLLVEIFAELRQALCMQLHRAQENGELQGRFPVTQVADFILANLQGLLLLSRVRQDPQYVEQQIGMLKETVLAW